MSENDVTLRVEGVTKRFGDFTAVEDLSFKVRAGRVFGFLGPNGAGKTTTIRMIVGITAPDEGKIELFGERMSASMQDRIGYLPEERGLYKKMKIVDQLRYFAALKDVPRAVADKRIDFWLERMNLAEWKNKKTTDLSKGMQQKIQFISTVLHNPDLLILDEPFSGLDVQLRARLQEDTLRLLKETRATSMIVTHNPEEAMRLGDRIVVMRAGRIVQVGSLAQLHRDPVDLFVARLFSEINEIPWIVEGGALRTPVGTFWVPEIAEGEAAVLCIRQRAIGFGAPGAGQPGRVRHVRPLGDAAIVEVAVQGFEAPLKVRVREIEVPSGEGEISVIVDPERVLVFPAEGKEKPPGSEV